MKGSENNFIIANNSNCVAYSLQFEKRDGISKNNKSAERLANVIRHERIMMIRFCQHILNKIEM